MHCGHETLNNAKFVTNITWQDLHPRSIRKRFQSSNDIYVRSAATQLTENELKSNLASGARQLVVQLALDTISMSGLYPFSLTPTTNMRALLLGAEMTTFFAPPC